MRVELRPLESGAPGQGRLLLKGWKGATTALQLTIQESQDQQFLHPGKTWSTKTHSFEVASLEEADAERLQVVLDSTIIDPLLELPGSTQYLLTLQDSEGTKSEGVIRLSRDLMPSSAAGTTPSTGASTALHSPPIVEKTPDPAPEPEIKAPAEPEPEPEKPVAEPPSVSKASKRGPLLFLLLGLLLLAAVALGAWYWFSNNAYNAGTEPVTQENIEEEDSFEEEEVVQEDNDVSEEEADLSSEENQQASIDENIDESSAESSAGPATACSIEALDEQDELTFVQGCSQADMTPEALLSVIEAARDADHCGIARRLYANRALAGDASIALAYAREYDPAYHQANTCFSAADAETAGYWYQIVLDIEPDNSEAQARFEELGG
ncbi:hypothetical protein LOS15_03530 [Halomonas sp. 7T]|uniref:hypothetical protein n=1 Tax=Halomonas sp. 7T TaxID=2893469 RepID=UPI0021D8C871|nr:hypothetical protein [Halomonas sp. 7T]UXZ55120.1 hypothetical protein LOS15_03530 [Halomonas sp. 7T]